MEDFGVTIKQSHCFFRVLLITTRQLDTFLVSREPNCKTIFYDFHCHFGNYFILQSLVVKFSMFISPAYQETGLNLTLLNFTDMPFL